MTKTFLVPPDAFGIVEEGIYRSNIFTQENIKFLKTLKLKGIVLLSRENPTLVHQNFIKENNLNFYHLGKESWDIEYSWKPLADNVFKDALEIILDARNAPVLVMCTNGLYYTGILCGCLRKIQCWCFNYIIAEYRAFCGRRSRSIDELFIELFDTDIVTLTSPLPKWFEAQRCVLEEL